MLPVYEQPWRMSLYGYQAGEGAEAPENTGEEG